MTGKERAKLKGMANKLNTTIQVGKNGVTDEVICQVREAITANELIKIRVLETAGLTAKETAAALAETINAEVVQVIGARIVLFKENPEKKVIEFR